MLVQRHRGQPRLSIHAGAGSLRRVTTFDDGYGAKESFNICGDGAFAKIKRDTYLCPLVKQPLCQRPIRFFETTSCVVPRPGPFCVPSPDSCEVFVPQMGPCSARITTRPPKAERHGSTSQPDPKSDDSERGEKSGLLAPLLTSSLRQYESCHASLLPRLVGNHRDESPTPVKEGRAWISNGAIQDQKKITRERRVCFTSSHRPFKDLSKP